MNSAILMLARAAYGERAVAPPDPDPGALLGVARYGGTREDYPPTGPVTEGDWYVSPSGSDSTSGGNGRSVGAPLKSIHYAFSVASPGDTILVRAGTYTWSERLNVNKAINLFNYGTERPLLDMSGVPNVGFSGHPINIAAANVHVKGFEIVGARTNSSPSSTRGVSVQLVGDVIIEDVIMHHSPGGTFYLSGGQDCLVLDCVGYANGDPTTAGTNTIDGFVATADTALNCVFVRCLAANYPDDNFDVYRGKGHKFIACASLGAGYHYADGSNLGGDGNGFKCGGAPGAGANSTLGCVCIGSRRQGVVHNSSPYGNEYMNITTIRNGRYGINEHTNGSLVRAVLSVNNGPGGSEPHTGDGSNTYVANSWQYGIDSEADAMFADPDNGDFSLLPGSPAATLDGGHPIGAYQEALELVKRWWGHPDIWLA